jgi:hypothetical protein
MPYLIADYRITVVSSAFQVDQYGHHYKGGSVSQSFSISASLRVAFFQLWAVPELMGDD